MDFLGLHRSGAWSQIIDQQQDFSEQVPGHGDFRHLERDLATMADNFDTDFDQLLPEHGQRPVFQCRRQGECLVLATNGSRGAPNRLPLYPR